MVQEVFHSLMADLDSIQARTEGAFVGYLSTVIRNRVVDSIRFHQAARRDRRRNAEEIDDLQALAGEPSPSFQASSAEQLDAFCRALECFPERTQLLLRERLERGTPFADLAQQLGFPSADAARKALYAAQAKLLVHMRRAGIQAPDES
jgi:RNA polymerase sigma factor (sigma-70 family)